MKIENISANQTPPKGGVWFVKMFPIFILYRKEFSFLNFWILENAFGLIYSFLFSKNKNNKMCLVYPFSIN